MGKKQSETIKKERKRRSAIENFKREVESMKSRIDNCAGGKEMEFCRDTLKEAFIQLQSHHDEYCSILDDDDFQNEEKVIREYDTIYRATMSKYFEYVGNLGSTVNATCGNTSSDEQPKVKFQTERAPLPKFDGTDVTQYPVFKREMTRILMGWYNKADHVYVLKSCLTGNAKPWVEDVPDIEHAWRNLDECFGDVRMISDKLLSQIQNMKSLNDNDGKFADLFHLVKRSFIILKELKRESDLDNSTTIGQIEKKLSYNDRVEWIKLQRKENITPTIANLMSWMQDQIWIRNAAGSDIRAGGTCCKSAPSGAHQGRVNFVTDDSKSMDVSTGTSDKPALSETKFERKCWACTERTDHSITECKVFLELTPTVRLGKVRKSKACIYCLRIHFGYCNRRKKCMKTENDSACKYSHHELLHGAEWGQTSDKGHVRADINNRTPSEEFSGSTGHIRSNDIYETGDPGYTGESQSILPIITVNCMNPESKSSIQSANILLDSGSQLTLISETLATNLKLEGKDIALSITKVGSGEPETLKSKLYNVQVGSLSGKFYNLQAASIPKISDFVEGIDLDKCSRIFGIPREDLKREAGPIDILLGVKDPKFHDGEIIVHGNLAIKNTLLGPIVLGQGPFSESQCKTSDVYFCSGLRMAEPVDLSDFWSSESMGVALNSCCINKSSHEKNLSPIEINEAKVIRDNARKIENQWQIRYPWKTDPKYLPDNYSQVYAKLVSLERRLAKDPLLARAYDEQIRELLTRGCARKLTQNEISEHEGPVHYMSHHAVCKPESRSTPVRVVFNPASEYKGHVLNDYLMKGPDLLNPILAVLVRWREYACAYMGDVAKCFHQVLVDPHTDAHAMRFLWRNLENRKPDIYVKLVLTFGVKPSPAMANTALDLTAEDYEKDFPEACRVIKRGRYMDDICDSRPTEEECNRITQEIDHVLSKGHFSIKCWVSNKEFPNETTSAETATSTPSDSIKILGIVWNRNSDTIAVALSPPKQLVAKAGHWEIPKQLTKRVCLSVVASIYDVFGMSAPFTIRAKVAIQELWKREFEWDEILPSTIAGFWEKWLTELQQLPRITFDRCLTPKDHIHGQSTLIIFNDASKTAFGAVAYCRWPIQDGGFECRFLMAKSRVSPLKELEIPKLELQSAVLSARINEVIRSDSRLAFARTIHFTDSMIALAWIKNDKRQYKPFVSARVSEIRMKTKVEDWKYCPTDLNVADDITRGLKVNQLNGRFRLGPDFLRLPEEKWPLMNEELSQEDERVKKEVCPTNKVFLVKCGDQRSPLEAMNKYSKLKRAVRIAAIVRRGAHNFRQLIISKPTERNQDEPRPDWPKLTGPLTLDELRQAEDDLVELAQRALPSNYEKIPEYRNLSPFMDNAGRIRVGGRVGNSVVNYEQKHPILLPRAHWFSKLVVQEAHLFGHGGVATTVAKTRKKYWVIAAERTAKSVKHKCKFCRELTAKAQEQFMADLPPERVTPSPPFYYTCIDLFGPITIKIGRKTCDKNHGCIFRCMTTGAVYIDLATDYSTPGFLQVFRRFMSVRGAPAVIFSDQGSNLTGAERQLREVMKGWDQEQLKNFGHAHMLEWRFLTATAAHHNGCAESMVKVTKTALKHAIGSQTLTQMELLTVLFEAANLINSRPIGKKLTDPDDGTYLSPNEILMGRATSEAPQGPFYETKNPRHRYEFCQKIVDSFWNRWYRDVFPSLTPRKKWHTDRRNVRVDDFVLVKDENPLRGKYSRGRIVNVYKGKDDRVRSVVVRTRQGEYDRPISKIVVVVPAEGYED